MADKELEKAVKEFKLAFLKELPGLIKTIATIWFTLAGAAIMFWLDGRL